MKKTLRFTGGHILDIDSLEVGEQFLTRAHNVHTRKGFPSRVGGRRTAYGSMPTDPFHLLNLQLNTFNWWMVFGPNDIWALEGANQNDISYTGQIAIGDPFEWSSTLLNGIPVFTNGKDPLLYWTGDASDNADVVNDWPAGVVCKYVVAFKYHLFALNIDDPVNGLIDNLILHSDAAEPGTLPASWTPAPGNEAGFFALSGTPGRVICGVPLGQQLMIYKPTSVYAIEYAGQQPDNIFTNRPVLTDLGALGPHCVSAHGAQHLVLGNDDVVLTDGINVKSIAENRIKTFLANSIDEVYAQNSFVVRDLNRRETWVCVPESGSQFATVAHIWDERRDTWVTRDLTAARYGTTGYVTDEIVDTTWDGDSQIWDLDVSAWNAPTTGSITRVVIAEDDEIFVEDTTDPTSISASIEKHDLSLDDDSQLKLITRLWIRGTGAAFAALQFRLGFRNSPDDNITWQAFAAVEADGTPCEIAGRYISIQVQSTGTEQWTIDRIILEGEYVGPY